MDNQKNFEIFPIGSVQSALRQRKGAPRQPWEGAPEAIVDVLPPLLAGLHGLQAGEDIWVLTWLHQSERSVLEVHPRGNLLHPLMGVFATRSPGRPNPIGIHRTTVQRIDGNQVHVRGLEAIDATPVLDIKPVLEEEKRG